MEQIQFRPSDSGGKFDPVTQIDRIPAIDRRDRRLSQAEDQAFRQLQANNKTRQINAQRLGKDLEALAEFSKTLNQQLAEDVKARNEAEMQEGIMEAYYEGVSPEEQGQFKQDETALRETGAAANKLAEQVEEQTGDVFVADRFRSMSGWKKYGYAQGMVQQAAVNYATYVAAAKEDAQIVINGEVVTFENANNPEEYAALQEQVNRKFLADFVGVNPLLLNEYLFPQMQKIQKRDALNWAEQQRQERQQELLDGRTNDVINTVSSPNASAQDMSDFILQHPKGANAGKRELATIITQGLKDGTINGEDVLRIFRDTDIDDPRGVGSLISKDLGIFGGLEQLAEDAIADRITRDTIKIENEYKDLENDILVSIREGDGVITLEESKAILQTWKDNTNNAPLPDRIKDALRADDNVELEESRIRLNQIRSERGGVLFESDFKGYPERLKNEYSNDIRPVEAVTPSSDFVKEANEEIIAGLDTKFKITSADTSRTPAYRQMERNAIRDYERIYTQEIMEGSGAEQAHAKALEKVQAKINPTTTFDKDKGGLYFVRPDTGDQNATDRIRDHHELIKQDRTRAGTVKYLTEKEMEKGLEYLRGNTDVAPQHAVGLARSLGMPTYDLLALQANAYDIKLKKERPETEGVVDGLDPSTQELLRKYPSNSRTARAVTQTEGDTKWFLDSVAAYESGAHGEYDAMNTGGTGIGLNNQAYGSANSCEVTGCLSSMTLGEVIALQQQGSVFAAGRYQFIPATLRETAEQMGLSMDAPFNATTQDALAIGRLHWRLSQQNSLNGLRTEWQGLHRMPDAEAQELLETAQDIVSVYNRPENILPALRS